MGLLILLLAACSSKNQTTNSSTISYCTKTLSSTGFVTPSAAGSNELTFDIGKSSICRNNLNIPCTSITLCIPGTTQCQVVNNILIDTGSYGLRIFSHALQNNLCQGLLPKKNGTNFIGECAHFGSANLWGGVAIASIQLGQEPLIETPIQVINTSFGAIPAVCSSAPSNPKAAGFNGILGVGLGVTDCGSACVNSAESNIYYACSATSCVGTTIALTDQIRNPVSLLPTDNQGVILDLTSWANDTTEAGSATGTLIFGIATQSNNSLSDKTIYGANAHYNLTTVFSSTTLTNSFIDSGTNTLSFPNLMNLTECTDYLGFYCPETNFIATANTISATNASIHNNISFIITNTDTLINTGNRVFSTLGSKGSTNSFDWGLPFFLGRAVAICMNGASCNGTTGPFWAY